MEINDEKIKAVIEEALPKINSTKVANILEKEIITVIQEEIEWEEVITEIFTSEPILSVVRDKVIGLFKIKK